MEANKDIRIDSLIGRLSAIFDLHIDNFKKINKGEVNSNYELDTNEGKLFLRKYRENIKRGEEDLTFVHRVLENLKSVGFEMFAGPRKTKNPNLNGVFYPYPTLVKMGSEYFAVFEFIEGRDACNSDFELTARTLAYYHNAVKDFECPPRTFFTEVIWQNQLREYEHLILKNPETDFDKTLSRFIPTVRDFLRALNVALHESDSTLIKLVCHNDYHQGNIRIRDDKAYVTDFEGVGCNYRIYELAFAAIAFCTDEDPGNLKNEKDFWEKAKIFIKSYMNISKLTTEEIDFIPAMIKATYVKLLPRIIRHHYQNTIETDKRIKDETLSTIIDSFDWCNKNSRLIIEDLKSMG